MQILKSKKERQPEENEYAYSKGSHYQEVNLDKLASFREACKKANTDFEWIASNGAIFNSYGELLSFETENFCSRYPPNFCRGIQNEMALVQDGKISWNKEVVNILMRDSYNWNQIKSKIDRAIIDWDGFDWEKYQFDPMLPEIKKATLESALDKFANMYNELQSDIK